MKGTEQMATVTDELRRMLDEAGVEWTDCSHKDTCTAWSSNGITWYGLWRDGSIELLAHHLTPAQAVAATVGRDEGESYDAGFTNGIKAALQQLYGLLHEYPTLDEIEAWADSQWEEYE